MDTADQNAWAGGCASTTIFLSLNVIVLARLEPPVQSDQLSPFGADMTSATSLSLSIYNLLLSVLHTLYKKCSKYKCYFKCVSCTSPLTGKTWKLGKECGLSNINEAVMLKWKGIFCAYQECIRRHTQKKHKK